jgi:hypothetical protein
MCVCWRFAVSAARALPNHGGLTSPALVPCSASVCRQNCDFCGARTQLRQERRVSARRGVRKRICKGDTASMHETAAAELANVIAVTVAQPRGADAPRSCVARMRVCWGFATSAARALPNHGGLTPPALGCTCVCASQKSSFHRQRFVHSNRSGGREPAVVCGNTFARAIPQTCGRLPPVCRRTSLQSRSPGERR